MRTQIILFFLFHYLAFSRPTFLNPFVSISKKISSNDFSSPHVISTCSDNGKCLHLVYDFNSHGVGIISNKSNLKPNQEIQYHFDKQSQYDKDIEINGFLGLAKFSKYEHEQQYSYVSSLYNKKIISNKTFGHYFTSKDKIKLFFGFHPRTNFNNYCFTNSSIHLSSYWNCQMELFQIQDKKSPISSEKMELNDHVLFNLYINAVIIPYKYGFPLFDRLLKLSSSHCFMHTEKYFFYISCKELPDEKDIPSLVFSLKGGASLELKSKDFFGKVPGRLNETLPEYKCKVYITHDNINWVIGTPILKNYDMIFDLEKEEIGFDSNCNFYSTIINGKNDYYLKIENNINYVNNFNQNLTVLINEFFHSK